MNNAIVQLKDANRLLVKVKTIQGAQEIIGLAEAARVYAQQAHLGLEAQNYGTEIKLRAERRAGEILSQSEMNKGGRPPKTGNGGDTGFISTLQEIGISKKQSSRWQRLFNIPEEHLARYIAECGGKEELSTAGFLRFHLKILKEGVESPPLPKKLFTVIYADPPWEFEFYQDSHRAIVMNYDPMTLEQICEMEIPSDSDAILFLWTPNPKVGEALQVIGAWGFNYRTNMVWVKDKFGMGYYVRNQHELLLIARRGKLPPPDEENRVSSVVDERRLEHSRKPDRVYEIIEKMYPNQRYIELFARKRRPGWVAWGLELNGQVRKE